MNPAAPHRSTDGTSSPAASGDALVVGVDYGTLSGRAVVVRVSDGQVLGSAVHAYPHAVMERALTAGPAAAAGSPVALPPDWALQVPADYVEVLKVAVPEALRQARAEHGVRADQVVGIMSAEFQGVANPVFKRLQDDLRACLR